MWQGEKLGIQGSLLIVHAQARDRHPKARLTGSCRLSGSSRSQAVLVIDLAHGKTPNTPLQREGPWRQGTYFLTRLPVEYFYDRSSSTRRAANSKLQREEKGSMLTDAQTPSAP